MPVFNTNDLLKQLEDSVNELISYAKYLQELDSMKLNRQGHPGKWSIAQVIEHLNSYNRYYLPEINKALQHGKEQNVSFNAVFRPGVFGNYFTKLMQPGADGKIGNKMNAPKDHRPDAHLDVSEVFKEFLARQQMLLSYLKDARVTDIGKLRVPISISRFVKLKLGDTFRFLIAHQQRHMLQAQRVLKELSINTAVI